MGSIKQKAILTPVFMLVILDLLRCFFVLVTDIDGTTRLFRRLTQRDLASLSQSKQIRFEPDVCVIPIYLLCCDVGNYVNETNVTKSSLHFGPTW